MLAVFSFVAKGAVTTESHTISFSESAYTFSYDENGNLVISAADGDATYSSPDEPGLPLRSLSLAIPGTRKYESSSLSFSKRLIRSNVTVAPGPVPVTTDGSMEPVPARTVSYGNVTYPASNCLYTLSSEWSDLSMIHFLTTPFIYDAGARKLYFIDSIQLTVRTVEKTPDENDIATFADRAVVSSIVANRDAVNRIPAMRAAASGSSSDANRIDYVVITSEELKQAFVPLVNWKRIKGLRSKIITTEEIDSKYQGESGPLRIKKCLYDLYKNNSLRYALLGGDDTVVPVLHWKKDSVIKEANIPADLYYACFGGDFAWDANCNGIYGELNDSINMGSSIFVSRLPVRTPTDVESFILKLLKYEKKPKWNNNMLMCGVKITDNPDIKDGRSDAEIKGNLLYQNYIKHDWNGSVYKFYDTYTDFPGGKDYDVTEYNLMDKLSNGYSFVSIMTHGSPSSWVMENPLNSYSRWIAAQQDNSASTIITTIACLTNAFDTTVDPCLSESFIRNPQSGVIAYLGCSRENWELVDPEKLGTSFQYEGNFYKNLFSDIFSESNYGVLVAAAKLAMINNCNTNSTERWVQFGLNPIGDPEMPIYTIIPKKFNGATVTVQNGELTIDTGIDGCRVCIMSAHDIGQSYHKVWENVRNISVTDFPSDVSICVTKKNYIPFHIVRGCIQNETLSGETEFVWPDINIGSDITPLLESGPVIFSKGSVTKIKARTTTIEPGTKIEKGAEITITNSKN